MLLLLLLLLQVRLEYAHLSRAAYQETRAEVLRGFGAADTIYFSRHAREEGMEGRAMENLAAEIKRLAAGGRAA